MPRRKSWLTDEDDDQVLGLFPGLNRLDPVPLPPKNPGGSAPPPPTGTGSGSGGGTTKPKSGGGTTKPKSGGGSSSSSGGNSYSDYLAQQRKAQNKAADRYISSANRLTGQANALRALLGMGPMKERGKPGGGGKAAGGKGVPYGNDMKTPLPTGGKRPGFDPATTMSRTSAGSGGKNSKPTEGKGGNKDRDRDGRIKVPGLRDELRQNLANVREALGLTDKTLMQGYRSRLGELEQSSEDNNAAINATLSAALSNRARERANALSELSAQGGGESDALRAQQMSLRNWSANEGEARRAYFDTKTSIASSLNDLNIDTKTARVDSQQQAIGDEQQLFGNYFDAKSETFTALGNTLGQMAEFLDLANEQRAGRRVRRRARRLERFSDRAFMQAARAGSQSHDARPVPARIAQWTGAEDFEGALNNGAFESAGSELSRPEGATLRKWSV
jgi:hypothetical protein